MAFLASGRIRLAVLPVAVVGLALSLLAAPARAVDPSETTCQPSAIDVPSCGLLWGLYLPRSVGADRYGATEDLIGRRLDLVKFYVDFVPGDTFPTPADEQLAAAGRTLYYSWNPVDFRDHQRVSYGSIGSGAYDNSVIIPEANAVKAYGGKVFIDFSHEFDNKRQKASGTAAEFAAAYRHIHTLFADRGVTNVIWSWVSTGWTGNKDSIRAGYPGASYVDWIGYDPYNLGSCAGRKWHSPMDTLHPFYDWVGRQPDMAGKPIILSEYAAANDNGVQEWYSSLPSALQQLPRIKALIQFSAPTASGCDTNVHHTAAAMAGFTQASNSAYVTHG